MKPVENIIEQRATALEAVGRRLRALPREVIARAAAENSWFSFNDIMHAVAAIGEHLLEGSALRRWLASYSADIEAFERRHSNNPRHCEERSDEAIHMGDAPKMDCFAPDGARNDAHPKPTVLIIMAGNIPLVGLFDMVCAAAAGWRALYKPSSKDTTLIDFAAEAMRAEGFEVERRDERSPIAALIATGSDNARRHFEAAFEGTPMLLRGTRGSVAVLSGEETCGDIAALAHDIFSYSGLGCRSVSHLLLPEGYDVAALAGALSESGVGGSSGSGLGSGAPSAGWLSNFRQRRAVLGMQWRAAREDSRENAGDTAREDHGEESSEDASRTVPDFIEGEFFILRRSEEFSEHLSEITYSFTPPHRWLAAHPEQVQCVVGDSAIPFGTAQSPRPTDYADGMDTMKFLLSL